MVDTFYRIKALNSIGIHIHLHSFEYGRDHSEELKSFCDTVHYYRRETGFRRQASLLPYIVSSRRPEELLKNLTKNDYPILFDGLHTTFFLDHRLLAGRMKLVRAHNIEHLYYKTLARNESSVLRKSYYMIESAKLKPFEKILNKADLILPISLHDQEYYESRYPRSVLLSPFHPYDEAECKAGYGEFILYHGNMSVRENALLAEFLTDEVFSRISFPCVIAGNKIPEKIMTLVSGFPNIKIVRDPDHNTMKDLISKAHIHLLPALSNNGFKIKLLTALFGGRHCLVNSMMLKGTMAAPLCQVADSPEEMTEKINVLMGQSFTESMIHERKKLLNDKYNNTAAAKKLTGMIFPGQYL
jgi:hypothetical protein